MKIVKILKGSSLCGVSGIEEYTQKSDFVTRTNICDTENRILSLLN